MSGFFRLCRGTLSKHIGELFLFKFIISLVHATGYFKYTQYSQLSLLLLCSVAVQQLCFCLRWFPSSVSRMNLNDWPKSGNFKVANFRPVVGIPVSWFKASSGVATVHSSHYRYLAADKLLGPINVKTIMQLESGITLLSCDCPPRYLFGGRLMRYCVVSLNFSAYHHKASHSYRELISQFRYVVSLSLWSRHIIAITFSLYSSILRLHISAAIRITTLYG